jgi:gamma-glutamyltranspeptidase/glutathione hydrolase
MIRTLFLSLLAVTSLAAPLPSLAQLAPAQPEAATGRVAKPVTRTQREMVVAANPLAAQAGAAILAAGGSAVDAAITVQLVLGLVEPQSSGIGGGAFLLHWDQAAGAITTHDARETAPALLTPDAFLRPDGTPKPFYDAVVGGLAVGVPGVPRLLADVHAKHGKLPWADLFQPAIALARDGFAISPRLAQLVAGDRHLAKDPAARAYFYEADGTPKAAGTRLANPDYAAVLTRLARDGVEPFYRGDIAQAIIAAVAAEPNPGRLSAADMAAYRVVTRPAVCAPYRGHRVCGMGPPSSGGVAVAQTLALLEPHPIRALPSGSAAFAHLFAQAGAVAFADRDRYLADPDHVAQPIRGLLDQRYLAERAKLVAPDLRFAVAEPGVPAERAGLAPPPADSLSERPATTHVAIVDAAGNAVSLTTTIEDGFGARRMTQGFLLNNQLTDFAFRPLVDGRVVANAPAPGKRPRSSMAPTLVFDADGRLSHVVGSPGGSRIIGYVARALVAMIDWDMDPQAAVSLPHVINRNGATDLEKGTAAEALKAELEAQGHRVAINDLTSGLGAIRVLRGGGLEGGADPRREGLAVGR